MSRFALASRGSSRSGRETGPPGDFPSAVRACARGLDEPRRRRWVSPARKETAMNLFISGRHVFGISAAVAMLSACASSASGPMLGGVNSSDRAPTGNKTFKYTGAEQSFKVPAGVTKTTVVARGAAGGGASGTDSGYPYQYFGRGGRVYAIIPVKTGQTLYVFVGGQGSEAAGGFNSGGNPGPGGGSYGGGGASDVRQGGDSLNDRIVVAGGGGGQGGSRDAVGGRGGGAIGGSGGSYCYRGSSCIGGGPGTGGTQNLGGSGGEGGNSGSSYERGQAGTSGTFGSGGSGGSGGCYYGSGNCGCSYANGCPGAGGGGGYYGGGGGGGGAGEYASIYGGPGGGGGGGSSYIEPSAIKFHSWQGWKKATTNGLVVFSWK